VFAIEELTSSDEALRFVRPSENLGIEKKLSMISENHRESDEMVLSCASSPL
jgi:hypothetical protein